MGFAVSICKGLRGLFDAGDVLFYGGVSCVAYGFSQIYEPYGWIAFGGLMIVHVYVPEFYSMLSLFAPARKAERR